MIPGGVKFADVLGNGNIDSRTMTFCTHVCVEVQSI